MSKPRQECRPKAGGLYIIGQKPKEKPDKTKSIKPTKPAKKRVF